jgi:hypothetical protein
VSSLGVVVRLAARATAAKAKRFAFAGIMANL